MASLNDKLRAATEQFHAAEIAVVTHRTECESLRAALAAAKDDGEAKARKWKERVQWAVCMRA